MKTTIITLFAITLTTILIGCDSLGLSQSTTGPRILFPEQTRDFGDVQPFTEHTHSFIFYNEGDSALCIRSIVNSCGCTASHASRSVIPPGGESEILTTLEVYGTPGPRHRTISIQSNDRQNPQVILHLYANVLPDPNQP